MLSVSVAHAGQQRPFAKPTAATKKPSVTRRKPLSPPRPETVSHAVNQSNALQNVLQLPGPASAAEPYLAQKIVEQHNQLQVGEQKLAQLQQYDLIEHQQEEQRQQKERMDQCFHQLTFQQQGQSLLLQQQLGKQLAPSPNQTTSPSFLEAYMYQAPLIPQVSSAMDARPTFAGAHGGGLASYFYSSTIVPQSPGALQESMINTPVQFEPQRTTTLPSRGIGSYRATFEQVPGYRPIQVGVSLHAVEARSSYSMPTPP